ncbi:RDD family protein [Halomonas dongshanensis]|uniref:RDD family protein n=1 Tax=Halomonas dongshanensis TaxID=2890835 RepID=A0ABT2E9W3_9GAMM|nr:RDD family protein [Halomonas dongshanensis]MCS2608356.1 RDD family protein [Halomonas dongshanensis]
MTLKRLSSHAGLAPASLPRRLGAMLYDGILLAALWFGVAVVHLAFFRLLLGVEPRTVGADSLQVWSLRLLLLIATTSFFLYAWSRGGMTLGMQAWRLRVQTPDGYAITLRQGLLRCATAWLSLAALGAGYWWVLIDTKRRSWPDIVSKTTTVHILAS